MHAALRFEITVSIIAHHQQRRAFDTGLVAGLDVHDLVLESARVAPAAVHAQQHVGPVAAFRAAGTGVDAQNRVRFVVLATKQAFEFKLVKARFGGFHLGGDFVLGFAQFDQHSRIGKFSFDLGEGIKLATDGGCFVVDGAGVVLIGPEGRAGHDVFQFNQTSALFVGVKDTSSTPRGVPANCAPSL